MDGKATLHVVTHEAPEGRLRAALAEIDALEETRSPVWALPVVSDRGVAELGWRPIYDFNFMLECLRTGRDFRSPPAREVGTKGYHATAFEEGPYPVG